MLQYEHRKQAWKPAYICTRVKPEVRSVRSEVWSVRSVRSVLIYVDLG